ncbi:MAG: redoxin domain-containing protein [Polyangiaceae bacterium]|nr:redoxin domain-containing protein [Polyangiaceae bacterium]
MAGPPVTAGEAPLVGGWLGVELAADPLGRGIEVRSVFPGSPAEAAGIAPGDILVRLDGTVIREPRELTALVRERGAGARVGIALLRRGQPRIVATRLVRRPDDDELVRREFLGRVAPPFGPLVPAQGQPALSLGAYRGKVIVLEFWAPWCAVCRILAPELTAWHEDISPSGGLVLGIAAESLDETSAGARELGIGYPVLADEAGDTTLRYRAFALPTLFVIDRMGIVRDLLVGYDAPSLGALMAHVDGLLGEPAPAP